MTNEINYKHIYSPSHTQVELLAPIITHFHGLQLLALQFSTRKIFFIERKKKFGMKGKTRLSATYTPDQHHP